MIVRQFLQWVRSATAAERAEATSALCRAYLYSNLSPDDRAAAEGAMILLLDDPSPLVRQAMATLLAPFPEAPPPIIHGLAADQSDIAAIVIEHSPLFIDADLVDLVATSDATVQMAAARRAPLQSSVAAAVAEVGAAEACLVLIENPNAEIADFSVSRIVARFGHLAAIREALFARNDILVSTRQALVAKLSTTLADFVASRDWLDTDRAHRVAREACEKATVSMAAEATEDDTRPLIRHLCESGQLTAGLILRALLSGNITMFEEALTELSGFSVGRVRGLVHDDAGAGFRALFDRAGLPASTWPAFRAAVEAIGEDNLYGELGGTSRLKRRVIERVLTSCAASSIDDVQPLLTLLRRFATEAAREEARLYCEDLVDNEAITLDPDYDQIAA